MIFRRPQPHPALDAFLRVAERVDQAQRALLAAIPTPRDDGMPLADAIAAFEAALAKALALMPEWRADDLGEQHARCERAIHAALDESRRLATENALTFEQLNARVGDVLHPLEEMADVERLLRRGRGR